MMDTLLHGMTALHKWESKLEALPANMLALSSPFWRFVSELV